MLLVRNVTRRFPESIIDPRVGHALAATGVEGGAYDITSSPAVLNTVSNADAAKLSEFTIRSDRTTRIVVRMEIGSSYWITYPRRDWHPATF